MTAGSPSEATFSLRTAVLAAPDARIWALLGVIEAMHPPTATEDHLEHGFLNLPKPAKTLDVWLL